MTSRAARIPTPCLTMVTDRNCRSDIPLEHIVAAAVDGGVTMVQLREKDLSGGPLLELAIAIRKITLGTALLFINERVDVAIASGADGVHLPENGLPVQSTLAITERRLLIGRSVHDIDGARQAQKEGADLIMVGTIFSTRSKPHSKPAGLALIDNITQAVDIPVLGIGGIDSGNAHHVIQAGAHGVAVIGAIMDHPDPRETARSLKLSLASAWNLRSQSACSQ